MTRSVTPGGSGWDPLLPVKMGDFMGDFIVVGGFVVFAYCVVGGEEIHHTHIYIYESVAPLSQRITVLTVFWSPPSFFSKFL